METFARCAYQESEDIRQFRGRTMKTIHQLFPLEVLASIARLSSPAPGALSISLIAFGLVFATVAIKSIYWWIGHRKSHPRSHILAEVESLEPLTLTSGRQSGIDRER